MALGPGAGKQDVSAGFVGRLFSIGAPWVKASPTAPSVGGGLRRTCEP